MDATVINEKHNPLFHRKEYVFKITFSAATPSRQEIRDKVIQTLGSKPERTVVAEIKQTTGKREIDVFVNVYDDEEHLKQYEPLYILKRNGLVKEGESGKEGEGN